MNGKEIRRFSKIEIAYHWIQAIPYLILVATGGLLLLQRLFGFHLVAFNILSVVHRVVAIILILVLLQILVLIIFAEPFRVLIKTMRESLSWGPKDFLWFIKVFIASIRTGTRLPGVGRFNPGQKVHLVAIIILLPSFTMTGLYMMLVPGALAPWMIHLILFLMAGPFLALHLFLALVNPETRRSLGSVFHGHVSEEFAEEHHPLWVGKETANVHKSLVSLKVIMASFLVTGITAYGLAAQYGFEHLKNQFLDLVNTHGTAAIMPDKLSMAHSKDSRTKDCFICHELFSSPASERCLECHSKVGESITGKFGLHAFVEGECRICHAEHQGESADLRDLQPELFNHNVSRFPLEGAHIRVKCEKCHLVQTSPDGSKSMKYMGLAFQQCTDCHQNIHSDPKATDCLRCHTMNGWDLPHLVFNHERDSIFPLNGKHVQTDCMKCHGPNTSGGGPRLFGIGTQCVNCHEDPHHGQFEKGCDACHSEKGWNEPWVADPHGRNSEFPLVGQHATLECTKCHKLPEGETRLAAAQFVSLPDKCAGCHQDPHKGGFGIDCERCHSETDWKGRSTIEGHGPGTRFPLTGKHINLSCDKCHKVTAKGNRMVVSRAKPLPVSCEGCHKDPHRGQFKQECTECHSTDGWKGRWLVDPHGRNSSFPLRGKHAEVNCESCHPIPRDGKLLAAARFHDTPKNCEGCHRDPHHGEMSATCSTCHSEQGWKGTNLKFSHNEHSIFKLDNTHKSLQCSFCHGTGDKTRYRPLPTTCEGCHQDISRQFKGISKTKAAPPDPHDGRVKCNQCHLVNTNGTSLSEYAAACRSCHNDRYEGLFYDWMKTFREFKTKSENSLKRIPREDVSRRERISQRIKEAEKIGIHNVQLAQDLWRDILDSSQ